MNKKDKKKSVMRQALDMELREHKSSFAVYAFLRGFVILALIRQTINGNYENAFLCVLTLILLVMPGLIQLKLKVELPSVLEIILLLFIFAAEILGEIHAFYIKIDSWDTILHTMNGFLMAAIGFALVDILNRQEKLTFRLSPLFMAVVAFCFSMTIGVLWEFFEFSMDYFFMLDMQKDTIISGISSVMLDPTGGNTPTKITGIQDVIINGENLGLGGYLDIGIIDTMKDLFVNFIGAVVFSVIGYFYVKSKGNGRFAKRFIPQLKAEDTDYLAQVKENQEQKKEGLMEE